MNILLFVIMQLPLRAVWRLPVCRKSRLLRNLRQKSYIVNVKCFPFSPELPWHYGQKCKCILHIQTTFFHEVSGGGCVFYTTACYILQTTVTISFYLLVNNNIGQEFFLRLRELNEMTHWWSRLTKAWDDNLAIIITSTLNHCTWSGDTAESPLALFSWLAVLFSDRHAAWYSFFACISFVYFFSHGFWAWNVNCRLNFTWTMVYG